MKISKLFCKIGLHWWNDWNCALRLENEQLVSDTAAIYSKQKIKEIIHYSVCDFCNKIRIDAHYEWKLGTKRFGDNMAHDNNNGPIEMVIREYLKSSA